MDWTVLLGGVISGVFSLAVCIVTQLASNKATIDLLEYRLTQLEKKVDKHNNLVERMYKCEEAIMVLQAQQKGDDGR
jgi:hypothetical protein